MAVLRCGIFSVLLAAARGFYLPGVAVREYQQDERVDIKVNKLTSTKTQLVRAARRKRESGLRAGARRGGGVCARARGGVRRAWA